MKVAAYQTPIEATLSLDVLGLIREQIERCEALGVQFLCCPEGVLGGLADYAVDASGIAISSERSVLNAVFAPLASESVTTIIGFTEIDSSGRLFNSAAIYHRGSVVGSYRKVHPFINSSVYQAGTEMPVFTVNGLTFGIIICRDSVFPEPARVMASRGATMMFVPTNNGLPRDRTGPEIVTDARRCDIARAIENSVSVIRADVTGRTPDLISYGSSGIVHHDGVVLGEATLFEPGLVVADIDPAPVLIPGAHEASRSER